MGRQGVFSECRRSSCSSTHVIFLHQNTDVGHSRSVTYNFVLIETLDGFCHYLATVKETVLT